MQYRADIDGLRAVAVLGVVAFHFGGAAVLPGGFVGVDVFFVISGYLITGILKDEADAGRLSIVEFYHRRIRRIFPALFVTYVGCIALAGLLLWPAEAREVGHEILASLAFVSNVVFARAEGYFDEMSGTDPLLHTWSLSVEEQFYLVLPLLLAVLTRFGARARILLLGALAALSFAAAQHALAVDARDAFFLVPSRAWELLSGSLLALGAFGKLRTRVVAEIAGALGLFAIGASALRLDGSTPFPGVWALPACLGAVAVLHAGKEHATLTSRLLATAPLRYVGLVSYSLYLWHWPLLAFYRARYGALSPFAIVGLLVLALLLAAASYRFVERPFRQKPYRVGRPALFGMAAAGAALVATLALGVPRAVAAARPELEEATKVLLPRKAYTGNIRSGVCFISAGFDDFSQFKPDQCLKPAPGRYNLLVLGDSHAAHFTPAFAELYPEINVMQATASSCQPVRDDAARTHCKKLFSYVFDEFLPHQHVNTLVLAGHWPAAALGPLRRTINEAQRYVDRIVVLGPPVEYDAPFPKLLARSLAEHDPDLPARHRRTEPQVLDRRYAHALRASHARYFSVYDATCPQGRCTLWAAHGVPMHLDRHHLTQAGAVLVLKRLGSELLGHTETSLTH
jgi:peptidoglycan/LPS O-acetylase OafA/YrhL